MSKTPISNTLAIMTLTGGGAKRHFFQRFSNFEYSTVSDHANDVKSGPFIGFQSLNFDCYFMGL